ncbi:MAG: VWA domain-containing protein [Pyrinomonadaceae bacterium]|nr:VWA domain-containing protein [Pyrinomonadaceae bacterium]
MRFILKSFCCAFIITLTLVSLTFAQSGRSKQRAGDAKKNQPPPQAEATPTPTPSTGAEPVNEMPDLESVKVETNLVTVPVIVSDRNNLYIPDMQQEEFTVEEDGVRQELIFFGSITQPFHVVLMLDTSGSTQEKLGQIQRAATAFVNELQPADRVKLISFDDKILDYGDFTNDREAVRAAIGRMRSGNGTKLYDAMRLAIASLKRVQGRKAIIIFTDGVDWHSDHASIDENRRQLEEAGIIVYPIRYDTREESERSVRQQQRDGQRVDLGTIFGGGSQSPTTPSANPDVKIPLPPGAGKEKPTIGGIPIPPILIPQTNDPNRRNDPTRPNTGGQGDDIDQMLNLLYSTADGYLNDLALVTGGKLYRADMISSLPVAFASIAAELRTQYSLGYYPTNAARDGKFRKIKVRTTRKGLSVRARPGYRAPKANK